MSVSGRTESESDEELNPVYMDAIEASVASVAHPDASLNTHLHEMQHSPLPLHGSAVYNYPAHFPPATSPYPTTTGGSSIMSDSETLTSVIPPAGEDEGALQTGPARDYLSYSSYQRQQALQPNKWLSEIDVAPYFRQATGEMAPSSSAKPHRTGLLTGKSSGGGRGSCSREPLLEELLPTSQTGHFPRPSASPEEGQRKDVAASTAFMIMFGVMCLIGLMVAFLSPAELRDRIVRATMSYRTFVESIGVLSWILAFSAGLSLIWVFLVRQFTKPILYLMISLVPATCLVAFLWAFFSSLSGSTAQDALLFWSSFGILGIGALFSWSIYRRRGHVQTSIDIVKTAADILHENPAIFGVSMLIILAYLAVVAVWLFFFAHLLLLGHVDAAKHWQLSAWSYWLQAYFLLMLAWTTAVFTTLQKFVIGRTVSCWYFYRHEQDYAMHGPPAKQALEAAVTAASGQICFAALILSTVQTFRLTYRAYTEGAKRVTVRWLRPCLHGSTIVFSFFDRMLEHVSDFAVYRVAMTGEEFCTAGRAAFRILRRNFLVGLTTDMLAQMILATSSSMLALAAGLITFVFSAHVLGSEYGWYAGLIYAAVTWFFLRFFSGIFSDTIDATFMCFAIDIDNAKVHCTAAHQAFSARLSLAQSSQPG